MKMLRLSILSALGCVWLSLACASASVVTIDREQSTVQVTVKATGDDFVATLAKYEAKLEVNASNGIPTRAIITWNFQDLKTGNKSRDKEMLHWLEHSRWPTAKFIFKEVQQHDGKWMAAGALEMHGVSRNLVFPLEIKRESAQVAYSGDVVLDHRDFGLEKIVKFLVLKVDPVLKVHFELSGVIEPQGAVERREKRFTTRAFADSIENESLFICDSANVHTEGLRLVSKIAGR